MHLLYSLQISYYLTVIGINVSTGKRRFLQGSISTRPLFATLTSY